MFARDLRYMMYDFGDVRDPNYETVALVEDLMVDFITNVAHQAMECAERRGGRFSNNDLLYVIRNDEKKMRRVEELMEMNEYLKEARKNFDLADPTVVEKTVEKDPEYSALRTVVPIFRRFSMSITSREIFIVDFCFIQLYIITNCMVPYHLVLLVFFF